MNNLLLLIPAALTLGLIGLAAFLWALNANQFEDLDGAAQRVLFDEKPEDRRPASQASSSTRER